MIHFRIRHHPPVLHPRRSTSCCLSPFPLIDSLARRGHIPVMVRHLPPPPPLRLPRPRRRLGALQSLLRSACCCCCSSSTIGANDRVQAPPCSPRQPTSPRPRSRSRSHTREPGEKQPLQPAPALAPFLTSAVRSLTGVWRCPSASITSHACPSFLRLLSLDLHLQLHRQPSFPLFRFCVCVCVGPSFSTPLSSLLPPSPLPSLSRSPIPSPSP